MSNPLSLVRDNPLTVQTGATDVISASDNLAVSDTEYGDAQLTYTVVTAPSDGILLDDGVQASTFTQADLDNGLVSYQEDKPTDTALSDSFFFRASDPSSNQTATTLFQINVAPPSTPVLNAPGALTAYAGLTAAIHDVQVIDNQGDNYTVEVTASSGQLSAGTSSPGSSVSFTGNASTVNIGLLGLDYTPASSGHDTITITTTDLTNHTSISKNIEVTTKPQGPFTDIPGTVAYGINNGGQIVGTNGLLSNGTWTALVGAPTSLPPYSVTDVVIQPNSINDSGQIVGSYSGEEFIPAPHITPNPVHYGFLYDGTWTILDDSSSSSSSTYAEGINNSDEITGYQELNFDAAQAFIYQNGNFQDVGLAGTEAWGINNAAEIVGAYAQGLGTSAQPIPTDGFVYINGVFSLLADPLASSTTARSVNDAGEIVGYFQQGSATHGFAYNPTTGQWTTIDVPGAVSTYVYGINNSDQIVGSYTDANNVSHAFLGAVPPPLPTVPGNVDEWLMFGGQWESSAQPGSHPAGYEVAAVGDWTGNSTDGILWFNASTGDTDEWQLSNGAWANSVDLGTHPGNYKIAGVGDFTGNGTDDVLWTSASSSGQVQTDIWQLNNGQWAASVSPGSHPAGYQVAGIGDWTGNGTDGILWDNSTTGDVDEWQLYNGQWAASVDLGSHPGSGWTIAGVGDFTDNGIDDILWTNSTSSGVQTDIWELGSNGQWINSVSPGSHPAGSQVVGIGDFTGNGTSDILWQNTTTGDVDEWQISNGKWTGSIDLGTHPGTFQIAGAGDFTGNGTSDILWHSPS